MMNVPENELFSACLDGELTAEEQAKIEQLLATSPAARRLMDELRALSASLQALPAHVLEEDLSDRVLRLAERRMLAQPGGPVTEASGPPLPPSGWTSIVRRVFRPRALVWSGLAVAVAVILMMTEPQGPQPPAGDQIAMAPHAAETPPTGLSIQAVEAPAEQTEPAAASAVVQDAPVAVPEEKPEPDLEEAGRDSAAEAEAVGTGQAAPAGPMDLPPEQDTPALQTPPPAAVAEPTEPSAGPPRGDRPAPAEGPATDVARGAEPSTVEPPRPADEPSAVAAKAGVQPPGDPQRPAVEPILIVQCDVSPEAARQGVFDQILTKLQLSRVETAEGRAADPQPARSPPEEKTDVPAGVAGPPQPTLVEVEATAAQIQATLAELKRRPNDFLVVSPQPNLGRTTLRLEGVRIGGRTAVGKSIGSREFLSESAPATRSGLRFGIGTGKAAAAPGIRVQLNGQATPARARAKAGSKPSADKAPPKDRQVAPSEAEEPTQTERGLAKKPPRRALPKFRVRFVLRVAERDVPPADDAIPKKAGQAADAAADAASVPGEPATKDN